MTLLFPAEFANSSERVNASYLEIIRSPQEVQGFWYVTGQS